VDPDRVGAEPAEEARDVARPERGPGQLEPGLVDDHLLLGGEHVEDAGAELAAELQLVEELERTLAVPLLAGRPGGRQVERQVADQRVEAPVADHVAQVGAEVLPRLAGDLVGVGDDVVEAVVGGDPLGGRLRPHARDARQVVAVLADEGGELRVAVRRDAVLLLDRGRRHPGEVRHPAHRVEHRGALGDQLQRVAVAGQDQHLHPLVERPRREGGDDVVGLVAGDREVRDAPGVEHRLDQRQLAGELPRRLVALGLVVGVLLEPEGLPRQVEGDRDVGRLLVPEHVGEHRREAVDRVGVLAGGRREVLHRKREERAVGQRVAVEEQEPRGLIRHPASLSVASDTRMLP